MSHDSDATIIRLADELVRSKFSPRHYDLLDQLVAEPDPDRRRELAEELGSIAPRWADHQAAAAIRLYRAAAGICRQPESRLAGDAGGPTPPDRPE